MYPEASVISGQAGMKDSEDSTVSSRLILVGAVFFSYMA